VCIRITFFSCVGAHKTSAYNINIYSHHLWKVEVILTKNFGVRCFRFVTIDARGYKTLSYSERLSSCSMKHHNFFKTKVFVTKIYKNYSRIVMKSENLNPVHQELCELIFVELTNRTLFRSIRIIVCARDWQCANLGSVVVEWGTITYNMLGLLQPNFRWMFFLWKRL